MKGPPSEEIVRLELMPGVILVKVSPTEIALDAEPAAIEAIARVCHEGNRAHCVNLGDESQPEWKDAPDWQKASAMNGVAFHLLNPTAGPQASHESWLTEKVADGWVYGPTKDLRRKTHPCIVPFHHLPRGQQLKDCLFRAIVHAHVEAYQR